MILTEKFNNMVKTSSELKQLEIDRLTFWKNEKTYYTKYDNLFTGIEYNVNKLWINQINDLFKVGALKNKDENGETIVPDHFIYQLVNLTTSTPLTIRKIMQIALNIGQWKSATKNTVCLRIADNIFTEYNLENIESYLTKKDIENISTTLELDNI